MIEELSYWAYYQSRSDPIELTRGPQGGYQASIPLCPHLMAVDRPLSNHKSIVYTIFLMFYPPPFLDTLLVQKLSEEVFTEQINNKEVHSVPINCPELY